MLWLSNSTLTRLRDQLRESGQRPSVVHAPGATAEDLERTQAELEYGALCEAMYLMMSADGVITNDEREVLSGALRNLSGDALRSATVDAMLGGALVRAATEGRDARMKAVLAELRQDPCRAEVAFVLAAAIAFADNAIADEENELMVELAEGLGIDEQRSSLLLDSVEADLGIRC